MSTHIEIDSFDEKVEIKRVLGKYNGKQEAPSIIFIGGIHGNERAGVNGLQRVIKTIEKENIKLDGNFYALGGNINCLVKNIRYQDKDLNRVWTKEQLSELQYPDNEFAELIEQRQLYQHIQDILKKDNGPFYFIDLHTTSSETQPFITISDSLNNRKFSSNFSIPTVLGIEEYIEGPLLTYINEFGHIALGFEAGQHDKEVSVDNCEAFIWLALEASGCVHRNEIKKFTFYKHFLSMYEEDQKFYKIDYKYHIEDSEEFKMIDGFNNFEEVTVNQDLAFSNNKKIESSYNGKIFMPLYQEKGADGFFIISKISKFWLLISIFARKLKLDNLLKLLPGIKGDSNNSYSLIVNPKIAKYLSVDIFHLFGYRKRIVKGNKLHFIKRDRKVSEFE